MKYYCKICDIEIDKTQDEMLENCCMECFEKYNDKRKYLRKYFNIEKETNKKH
jgi:hypothetical protein